MSSASGLRQLHLLHLQLKEVLDCIERGPKQLAARRKSLQQKEAELETQKEKQKKLKIAIDQGNLQLKSSESKLQGLKVKLNTANSNKEYEIITAQIEADTMANSVLEDEIIALLEKVDEAKTAVIRAETDLANSRKDEQKLAGEIAAAEPGLQAKRAELEKSIAEAESIVPGDLQPQFRRLVQAHGAGAFSEVDGNTCTVCYVQLIPQAQMELRSGKLLFCKSCGRLMYLRPPETA
ncbi:MAG: hypothetical protein U0903_09505 [Planctomycetales bacterium]